MASDPILHLLGLARKAGKLELDEEPVGAACRARQARVVLLAADATPNTRRRCAHFGQAGNVLWLELPFSKEELGLTLGRGPCALLALTDAGFASAVGEKLAAREPEKYGPAASQLREKADRVLQRRREKLQHEKNVREGKKHPWAPPPPRKETGPRSGARGAPGADRPPHRAGMERDRTPRKGPGTRRLTGKFRHDP